MTLSIAYDFLLQRKKKLSIYRLHCITNIPIAQLEFARSVCVYMKIVKRLSNRYVGHDCEDSQEEFCRNSCRSVL